VAERRLHLTVDQASKTSQVRVLSYPPKYRSSNLARIVLFFYDPNKVFSSTVQPRFQHEHLRESNLAVLTSSSTVEHPTVNRDDAGSNPAASANVVRHDEKPPFDWPCGPAWSGRPTVSREIEGSNPSWVARNTVPDVHSVVSARRKKRSRNPSKNAATKHTTAIPNHKPIMPPESSRFATPSIEHVPPLGRQSSTDCLFGR
jgi:hypothetical protein